MGPAEAAWDLDQRHGLDRARDILALVPDAPDDPTSAALHTYLRKAEEQERATMRPISYEPQRHLIAWLRTCLRSGLRLVVAGVELRSTNVALNTALVAGSDPVRLAAKISGWCEAHCWVEGPERAWLADIIDTALTAGLYRWGLWYSDMPAGPRDQWSDQGWEQVLDLLRARDDEPVVMSYSAAVRFPNAAAAGQESLGDRWYDLPKSEQWQAAMDGLRRGRPWARLAPDTLSDVTFGLPVTVYDLLAPDRDDRVRAAADQEEAAPL
ncbi:hypothetical protein AB0A95_34640 [Micromonospora sp. NPDC049230]|uniref:hypothetical protein n=1 Tax=Micromonospora sp. NPDC049230 TaxID=3155502 RepID=UPI0033FD4D85